MRIASSRQLGASIIIDFDHPPVTEVALAVQFAEPRLDTLDVAALGAVLKSEFPQRTEQPPRPAMEETFEDTPSPSRVRFELLESPPVPRYWFLSEDGSRLVQVQQDMLAYNWRKMVDGADYPRYSALRRALSDYLDKTGRVIAEQGKTTLRPNWCEVTYVNHIASPSGEKLPPLEEILVTVTPPDGAFLPAPEDAQFAERFRISRDGEPVGRLTVNAGPAFRTSDSRTIWSLTLTARVHAAEPTVDAAFDALDLGHEWVVRGFRDITSERMHEQWGLREEAT